MRDKEFSDRLYQIRLKYGYAQQAPSQVPSINVMPPPSSYHQRQAPIQTPSYHAQTYRNNLSRQAKQAHSQWDRPSQSKLREDSYAQASWKSRFSNLPKEMAFQLTSSPIQRLGEKAMITHSPRKNLSPQRTKKHEITGTGLSPYRNERTRIESARGYSGMRYKENQAPMSSRKIDEFRHNKKEQPFHEKSKQIYQQISPCRSKGTSVMQKNPNNEQKGQIVQDKYNFNIGSIDKMQDRIALALKRGH